MCVDAVPTAVTLIFNQNNISITWNSPWMSYYIEVFTASYELLKNWTTHEPMIKLKLSNATQTVKIYVCPENHSEYTIGMIKTYVRMTLFYRLVLLACFI